MSKQIITSLAWGLKGYASAVPEERVDEQKIKEYERLEKAIKKKVKFTGTETIKETTQKIEEQLENLDLKADADVEDSTNNAEVNQEDDEEEENTPTFCSDLKKFYKGGKGKKGQDDNYIDAIDDISEEDEDDYTIHRDDSLILCTTTDRDGFSNLEVYIYNNPTNNLYVHHDITLSAYPLCVEWLPSYQNNSRANYAIVGTFLPEIEIWNLDVLDAFDPDIVLGDPEESEQIIKVKSKKKAKKKTSSEYHTDAVITLNLNPFNNNILASGSADSKVIIWDINNAKPIRQMAEHEDKVSIVRWNKREDNILLTTSYDKTLKLYDLRTEKSSITIKIPTDIECVDWNPLNQNQFLSSFENGKIELFDIRLFDRRFLDFTAHKKSVTSVSYSYQKNGLFASTSLDGVVKIWDGYAAPIEEKDSNSNVMVAPEKLMEKNIKESTGELFCCKFAEDLDYCVAVGGSKSSLFIWELEENELFCERYGLKYEGPNEEKIREDEERKIQRKKNALKRLGSKNSKRKK